MIRILCVKANMKHVTKINIITTTTNSVTAQAQHITKWWLRRDKQCVETNNFL